MHEVQQPIVERAERREPSTHRAFDVGQAADIGEGILQPLQLAELEGNDLGGQVIRNGVVVAPVTRPA